jgi:hypothetical protein
MIKPTVGRVVWYHPGKWAGDLPKISGQPWAAIVTGVWSDTCVNLAVFDANGNAHKDTSVLLYQGEGPKPDGSYCEWMPYQIGQAKKHEEKPVPVKDLLPVCRVETVETTYAARD